MNRIDEIEASLAAIDQGLSTGRFNDDRTNEDTRFLLSEVKRLEAAIERVLDMADRVDEAWPAFYAADMRKAVYGAEEPVYERLAEPERSEAPNVSSEAK